MKMELRYVNQQNIIYINNNSFGDEFSSRGSKFLDGPQNFDEAKQVLQWHAEEDARYAEQMAREYSEEAENLQDSDMSEEDVAKIFERMGQNMKERFSRKVDETVAWLGYFANRAIKVLKLNGEQTANLIEWAEETHEYSFRAYETVHDRIWKVLEKIREGIRATIAAAKRFYENVKEFVNNVISTIQQFFQNV
jgi:hypothetical protein